MDRSPFFVKKNNIEPKDIRTKFQQFNCSRYADFIIYFIWEESRQLLLERLYLFKIFIFKLKLLVQKLRTLAVTVIQIYRFLYLLYMGGATPTIASSPIFVQNIYIFILSCCYQFFQYTHFIISLQQWVIQYMWAWHTFHLNIKSSL